jgi:hypothetical protein
MWQSGNGTGCIATEWQLDRLYCDKVAEGQVILWWSGRGTGYTVTEWQRDRLYCDGMAEGQVILWRSGRGTRYTVTEWQWVRFSLYCFGFSSISTIPPKLPTHSSIYNRHHKAKADDIFRNNIRCRGLIVTFWVIRQIYRSFRCVIEVLGWGDACFIELRL